jgi:benzoate-CoA ligase family protein
VPLNIPAQFNLTSWFLDRPASEHPERIAILGEPAAFRYQDLRDLANRVGNALREMGCAVGDRVLIALPDSAEFMAAFFGAAKIGAVAVPVNPIAKSADLAYYLSDTSARFAIVHRAVHAELAPALDGPAPVLIVVGGGGVGKNCRRWDDWLQAAPAELEPHPTAANDPAFLLYTSGSSGQPKAAIHQHKDMFVTSRCFAQGVLGIRPDDRTFSISKLFFAYGLGNGMYFPLSVGASTILNPERTKVEKAAALIAKHRPTIFFAVPTFFAALLQEAACGMQLDMSSVRMVVSAGEPLPPEIFVQFRERFGLEILDGIGSTEMLQTFLTNRPGQARAGTCGVPTPSYEVRIVDDNGAPLPTGEVGTLWVKGESAFAGYWNKPELTARTKIGEWVVTGDKFFRDPDGYYHYYGRADDMMKVSGMWVSPGEVENALLGHERVAEAAVVGIADANGLLRTVACVVLRTGGEAGPQLVQEIQEFLRGRLASYKCPRQVYFVSELPKTATGKIQRFRLREQLGADSSVS